MASRDYICSTYQVLLTLDTRHGATRLSIFVNMKYVAKFDFVLTCGGSRKTTEQIYYDCLYICRTRERNHTKSPCERNRHYAS